jgi:hypothetical protein
MSIAKRLKKKMILKKMIKACNTNAVNWYYEPDVITSGRKMEKDSFPERHLF